MSTYKYKTTQINVKKEKHDSFSITKGTLYIYIYKKKTNTIMCHLSIHLAKPRCTVKIILYAENLITKKAKFLMVLNVATTPCYKKIHLDLRYCSVLGSLIPVEQC